MLAAPEATDWAAHPAARTGKLEKRGRLKDEWKARHFELRGCYLRAPGTRLVRDATPLVISTNTFQVLRDAVRL